jgi:hypothetical protein
MATESPYDAACSSCQAPIQPGEKCSRCEPDLTVYDLAERQAAGLEQSNMAGLEVYRELCRVKARLAAMPRDLSAMGKQRDNARELLELRDKIEALAKSMRP